MHLINQMLHKYTRTMCIEIKYEGNAIDFTHLNHCSCGKPISKLTHHFQIEFRLKSFNPIRFFKVK